MKNTKFYMFAGYAGILSALLFIISIVGMQYYLASSLENVHAFTQNMNEAHPMMLMYGWPGLVATVLIIPLVYSFFRTMKSLPNVAKMIYTVIVIGLCFVLVGYLFHLALTYFHAPMYHELTPKDQVAFGMLFKSTIGLQDMFWLAGDLFSFFGIAALLTMSISEGQFPKWLLVMGAVAGLFAATGSFSFIPAFKQVPGLSFLFIGGFSVFAIWEIIAGIFLIRLAKHSDT